MNPQGKAKQLWVLKDAVGDYLEWEPSRHTASDFIHVIEFEAYRKAVEALKEISKYTSAYSGASSPEANLAKKTLRELGVEFEA